MPLTRAEKEAQFKFIFQSILGLRADDVLYKVFESNNFTCIEDIVSMRDNGFKNITISG